MLALYILIGTGVLVWLWLVWDMAREARAKRGKRPAQPLPAGPTPPEGAAAKPTAKPAPKMKAQKRRPLGKVTYNRPKRRSQKSQSEHEPEPPPKARRDPREWTDDDYD